MISLSNGHFYINGKPKYIFAGEIHYFRLPKSLWKTHLKALIDSGCNTVSFYIPWLIHEPQPNQYEFNGESLEQYDLMSFIKLCVEMKLYIFLRPGPFVMAELYNEGVAPYVLEVEGVKPYTFLKKRVPNDQIDYLHPYFLERTKRYYEALFSALKPFTYQGGPVLGVQLDNEIGMLAWVSQSPALTEDVIESLAETFDRETYTFKSGDHELGHQRLGHALRARFSKYVEYLESFVQSYTYKDMLMFINVHGTEGGRGKSFPIGYSQLVETLTDRIIGTDIYFSHLTIENTHDYYLINSMLNALKSSHTPATSLEFNAGNSNFGDDLNGHDTPQSMEKKIRMNVIQGHQLINYYLLSAGMNPKIFDHIKTPNQRIAFTGERHGFSAPVQINGQKTYMYDQIQSTNTLFLTHEPYMIETEEVTSDLTFGFILDQYMTESMRHGTGIQQMKEALTQSRGGIIWDTFLKHSLLLKRNFRSIHLEGMESIDVSKTPVLAVGISTYMDTKIQEKLICYHQQGGKLMLFGQCPIYDMKGLSSTLLMDYLNIQVGPVRYDDEKPLLSAIYDLGIEGYPSYRTPYYQTISHNKSSWFHNESQEKLSYIDDRIILVTTQYPGHLELTQRMFDHLNVKPIIEAKHKGFLHIFRTQGQHGGYIHIMNIEGFKQDIQLNHPHIQQLTIHPFESLMLFDQLEMNGDTLSSTVECMDFNAHSWTFKTDGREADVYIETDFKIKDPLCRLEGTRYHCHVNRHAADTWTIRKEA